MKPMEAKDLNETHPVSSKPDVDPLEETMPTSIGSESSTEQEISPSPANQDSPPMPPPEANAEGGSDNILQSQVSEPSDITLPMMVAQNGDDGTPEEEEGYAGGGRRRWTWILWAFVGILALVLIAAGSGYSGYRSAISDRTSNEATQIASDVTHQYELAIQDLEAGNYELARQRFEYVIQLDPNYPGAAEKLSDTLLELRTTATPTTAPTPTLTPTPDTRGRDELYTNAMAALIVGEWSEVIDTLLSLRKQYPDFEAINVDGMLYVALRNRGIDKIAQEADLEGGTYDLTLALRFGPLDVEAKNWKDWAELYIRGASFWDIDWSQAVFYFSQLGPTAPNLRDGSGWTAMDRYILSLLGYGDWLAQREDWCAAFDQYELALELSPNPEIKPTANHAEDECGGGSGEQQEEPQAPTATPTPGGESGPTPTPEPTKAPTATEAPPPTPYP
jgi:tetratricopeptide (TPR) repeat protein